MTREVMWDTGVLQHRDAALVSLTFVDDQRTDAEWGRERYKQLFLCVSCKFKVLRFYVSALINEHIVWIWTSTLKACFHKASSSLNVKGLHTAPRLHFAAT